MGDILETENLNEHRQDDGTVTAWLPDTEELMELSHEGSSLYRHIFYILISLGVLYLTGVFLMVR